MKAYFHGINLVILVLALCLSTVLLASDEQKEEQNRAFSPEGSTQCIACHEALEHNINHLAASAKAGADDKSVNRNCEGCHGPSEKHTTRPKKFNPAIGFGPNFKSPIESQNQSCLGCHQSSQKHWQASAHENAALSCADCHAGHLVQDPILNTDEQVNKCNSCHTRVRSELNLPSHHPIKEGKTLCSDCHSAHGSLNEAQLLKPTLNETCFACHAEKRGPFLFEHAPASEDCQLCHRPHGSVNANLLNSRTPFLCQQCHSAAYHPSVANNGNALPGKRPNAALLGKNCLNCHNQVHGSNHPSGPALLR